MLRVREIDGAVNGRFSDGNPDYDYVGATKVSDYWLTAVQEEIVNPVLMTGQKLDEKKEFQLAIAMRKLSGFDTIINSDYFIGKSEEEKKRMNEVGLFESLSNLPSILKVGSKIRIETISESESKIDKPILIDKANVSVYFSSEILILNSTSDTSKKAFKVTGDGVQIIDARTKGFDIPFSIAIESQQGSKGFVFLDRCVGFESSLLVSELDTGKFTVKENNSTVVK